MLKAQIESKVYRTGDFLPPEPELERQFNVSRTTVRKAVEILSQQGFVYIQQGRGTEILDYKATQQLQNITSFSETLKAKGIDVRYKQLMVETIPAPGLVASDLNIAANELIVRIHRLTLGNGKPIAIMTNYIPIDFVPGIEKRISSMDSLYSFLESEYNLVPESAVDFISAREAGVQSASLLDVPEGYPLLNVRRITYVKGRPMESALLEIIGDRYEYSVMTKDRPPRNV
jgi:GntR family transcriptional regulator